MILTFLRVGAFAVEGKIVAEIEGLESGAETESV